VPKRATGNDELLVCLGRENPSRLVNRLAPKQPRKVVILLSVFGDESHDETAARVFAVAGLFGNDEQWGDLEKNWLTLTSGKVFHATECDTDQGAFAGIPHEENKKLYKGLTQVLCNSKIIGFGSAVDIAGHHEFFPDVPVDMPYYKCFRDVVYRCGKWTEWAIPQDRVKFTFDQRIESNYNAGLLYNYMATLPEWSGYFDDEISFASRKQVGIQAADLYAREVMKHLDNMIGPVQRPTRRSMEALLATKRFGCDLFMREHFEDFRRKFDAVAKNVGVDQGQYVAWLGKYRVRDSVSSRFRYLIDLK
jgi:hypothetical protein